VLLDKLVNNEPLPLDITPFLADRFAGVPEVGSKAMELA
jgi:hydrogen cyanide synthase HcnC